MHPDKIAFIKLESTFFKFLWSLKSLHPGGYLQLGGTFRVHGSGTGTSGLPGD